MSIAVKQMEGAEAFRWLLLFFVSPIDHALGDKFLRDIRDSHLSNLLIQERLFLDYSVKDSGASTSIHFSRVLGGNAKEVTKNVLLWVFRDEDMETDEAL